MTKFLVSALVALVLSVVVVLAASTERFEYDRSRWENLKDYVKGFRDNYYSYLMVWFLFWMVYLFIYYITVGLLWFIGGQD